MGAGGEALSVRAGVEHGGTAADEERPRLKEVTGRLGRELRAKGDPDGRPAHVDARTPPAPGLGERDRRLRATADPQIAERDAIGTDEESTHDRIAPAALAGGAEERRVRPEAHDARSGGGPVEGGDVQGRPAPVGELELDAVVGARVFR